MEAAFEWNVLKTEPDPVPMGLEEAIEYAIVLPRQRGAAGAGGLRRVSAAFWMGSRAICIFSSVPATAWRDIAAMLELAQTFFHRERLASIISINLHDTDIGEAFVVAVEAAFPELSVLANEAFGDNYSQFKILTATAWAVGFCAFLLGGMSVANTMTMSVFTRIREIAILRVSRFSRPQVARLILGEAACLSLLGLGLDAGFALLAAMERVPQLQGYVQAQISWPVIAGVVLTAFVTSLLGSAYPAWHASRIQPSEALRYE